MDVKLLHPVWKDFLDTVNTVVLTGYWKQLIIFLFDIQCFFQSGSECGPWIKIIRNSCLVIQKIHLDFFMIFFYLQCKSMMEYILVCPLKRIKCWQYIYKNDHCNEKLSYLGRWALHFLKRPVYWELSHIGFPTCLGQKKKYVCLVTRPTLIFASNPMNFYTEFG